MKSVYIHIPFCVKKCRYCDFLSVTASLIVQYQKKLFQDTPLPERFHETFGAGEEWEKLRLQRIEEKSNRLLARRDAEEEKKSQENVDEGIR